MSRAANRSAHGDHTDPGQRPVGTNVDIVRLDEVELAIATDSEYGEASRNSLDGGAIAHRERVLVPDDQNPSRRVEGEGAGSKSARVCVLDQRRLARTLIDLKDRNGV